MNWPLPEPPPLKATVPLSASTIPVLLNGTLMVVVPVVSDFSNNPALLKYPSLLAFPNPGSVMVWSLCALNTAPDKLTIPPVKPSMLALAIARVAVPVQFTLPPFVSTPFKLSWLLPLRFNTALVATVRMLPPDSVPPVHVMFPASNTVPVSVPPLQARLVTLPFTISVPPVRTAFCKLLFTVTVPPLTVYVPAPANTLPLALLLNVMPAPASTL